jgi:hypothetical protein
MPLVFGLALRTRLVTILPLILITWTANWKCTYMASNKGLSIYSLVNIITADLAHLDFFWLNNKQNTQSQSKFIDKKTQEQIS